MKVTGVGLASQVEHIVGLVGQFGISDAHMIDVCADEIADAFKNQVIQLPPVSTVLKPGALPKAVSLQYYAHISVLGSYR